MVVVDTSVSSSSSSTYVSDPSNPLHLSSSDVPTISLISNPFSGTGFGDESCPRPVDDSPQIKLWDRCNNMVISWMTSSVSPDIAESVQYSKTAQSSLDIASYFNKLKKLWDELAFLRSKYTNRCNCGGRSEEQEENKLYQFLMGLNDTYVSVRSNLLMMQPLPSLYNAYNILLQDERQRQVSPSPQFKNESVSFNVNFHNSVNKHPTANQLPITPKQYIQRVNFDQTKSNLVCKYCKKPEHLIEKCYKLHGFPPNFKFTKGKRIAGNVEVQNLGVNSDSTNLPSECPPDSASLVPGLTKEQYTQLLHLLQQNHVSDSPT
ncbi:uncharacterized protein LOC142177609 [Nicotiana tabacum]|uniref:Uncharacterized protein LOC142177609 n=1 Tax=Nicotiana tabacum TaxID=4097 RepID=A0AC58U0B3_TOBAC